MGRIHYQAHVVVVWLGEGDKLVKLAWDLVLQHAHRDYDEDSEDETRSAPGATLKTYWDAFNTIAVLSYWRRTRIVQELLLAQDVEL